MALHLTAGHAGLIALGQALARWMAHSLSVEVEVEPLVEMRDVSFAQYVGHDAEGTRIGNALWNVERLHVVSHSSVVGPYRLILKDRGMVVEKIKSEGVYLILAMTPDEVLRMKPQNPLTGLPLRHLEAVA